MTASQLAPLWTRAAAQFFAAAAVTHSAIVTQMTWARAEFVAERKGKSEKKRQLASDRAAKLVTFCYYIRTARRKPVPGSGPHCNPSFLEASSPMEWTYTTLQLQLLVWQTPLAFKLYPYASAEIGR